MAAAVTQAVSQVVGTGVFGENVEDIGVRIQYAAMAAVVGGTTSVLTGGKFANGAITGAFSRMFNDMFLDMQRLEQIELSKQSADRLIRQGEYFNEKRNTYFTSDGKYAYDSSQRIEYISYEDNVASPKFGFMQAVIPSSTAEFSKFPIGGSPDAQAKYGNTVNYIRTKSISTAVNLGGKGIDLTVTKLVIEPAADYMSRH